MNVTKLARRVHAMIDGGLWRLGSDEWTACDEPDCGICGALELVMANVVDETRGECAKIAESHVMKFNGLQIAAAIRALGDAKP